MRIRIGIRCAPQQQAAKRRRVGHVFWLSLTGNVGLFTESGSCSVLVLSRLNVCAKMAEIATKFPPQTYSSSFFLNSLADVSNTIRYNNG